MKKKTKPGLPGVKEKALRPKENTQGLVKKETLTSRKNQKPLWGSHLELLKEDRVELGGTDLSPSFDGEGGRPTRPIGGLSEDWTGRRCT